MTDTIEQKALALVRAHGGQYGPALEAAIEQHEAYKQEVSDAITGFDEYGTEAAWEKLSRFIIAKPDPLVEALGELADRNMEAEQAAETLRAAIEARGGRIVWEGE